MQTMANKSKNDKTVSPNFAKNVDSKNVKKKFVDKFLIFWSKQQYRSKIKEKNKARILV